MVNITDAINEFKTAPNGESVRSAFVEVMTLVNTDNISIQNRLNTVEPQLDGIDANIGSAATNAGIAVGAKEVAVTKAGEVSTNTTLTLGYKNETVTARDLAVGAKNAAELAEDNAKASETNSKTSENNSKASELASKTSETKTQAIHDAAVLAIADFRSRNKSPKNRVC